MNQQPISTLTLNPAVDQILDVDEVQPEKKLRTGQPRHDPGGGGINVARACRGLGGEASAVFVSGGFTGQLLQHLLAEANVPHHAVGHDGLTRLNTNVFQRDAEHAYRFVLPGEALAAETVQRAADAAIDACNRRGFLVLSGSLPGDTPPDAWCRVAARAGEAGLKVVLDTSGEPLRRTLGEAGVFLVKPNLRELGHIAGRELQSDEDIAHEARNVIKRGQTQAVLVSMGGGGAMLVTKDSALRLHAPTVPIRSRIGAGDSSVAGVTLALARGMTLEDAARYGVAAGAAAVMRKGRELCRREDADALYDKMQRSPE